MADYQWHPAYMDYTRRMGVTPSAQGQVDFLMRNNLGWGVTTGGGGGNPPPANPPPIIPPTTQPPLQPPPSQPPSGGGGGGGGGGGQPPLTGGGGGGGGSTTTSTTASTGGGLTPYIKSITSNGVNNNSGIISQLIQTLSQGTADANKAGMAQYTNLLNAVKGGSQSAMDFYKQAGKQINNFGASQKQDIEQTRVNERGELTQDLIGKGLGNTTILGNQLGGADTRATRANIALGDTISGMKSGLLERTGGMKLDTTKLLADSILSKQNMAPDMGMILNLLQSLGGTGGGSGARTSSPIMMR